MSKIMTPDISANGAIDYEEAINQMFAEMTKANEKMAHDQEEITILKAETQEIIERLKAA